MNKRIALLAALAGVVCAVAVTRSFVFVDSRPWRNDVVQGILSGFALALITAQIYAWNRITRVNGWITMYGCGAPGNGMFQRAAAAQIFPGPINVQEEAMYWTTRTDGAGRALSGAHNYVMHFPPGQLPPNDAFWSVTMGDAKQRFVANPLKRYSVSDRSGLIPNPDGSLDIYIQHAAPSGRESNWLPAPAGAFVLWLRVYLPGQAILNRTYEVPPVRQVA